MAGRLGVQNPFGPSDQPVAMPVVELLVGAFGHLTAAGIVWVIYRDALRNDISRPRFWTALCGATFVLGVWLFVFTDAPMAGTIMTANTGLVLYTFEREIANEDDTGRDPDGLLQNE